MIDLSLIAAPSIEVIQEQKLTHMQTDEIVRIILEGVIRNNNQNTKHLSPAMFTTAKLGISNLLMNILRPIVKIFNILASARI